MAYNTASAELYIRNGLYPREPLLRLVAPAPLVAERIATPGLEAVPIEPWPGPREWLGRIDEEVLGFRRESHHAFLLGASRLARCASSGRGGRWATPTSRRPAMSARSPSRRAPTRRKP